MKARMLIAFLLLGACSPGDGALRMTLPKALKEVSGLAPYQGDLIAIADEKARLYRISFAEQQVTRIGAIGDPAVEGDFEGIALANEVIYAITSDGLLYRKSLDDVDNAYQKVDTQFGELCEIEGLDHFAGLLYVLCKTPYTEVLQDKLVILVWDPAQDARVNANEIYIPLDNLSLPKKKLHPSGLVVTAEEFLILAARERTWVKVERKGGATVSGRLAKTHEQAEGLAIIDGATYIADEGKKRGTITRYQGVF